MSFKIIFFTLGNLLICLAGAMLFPLVVAIYYYTRIGEVIRTDLGGIHHLTDNHLDCGLILRF